MATPVTIRAVVLSLAVLLLAVPATAEPRKTILFVFDETPDLPGLAAINRSLRENFKAEFGGDVELWSESLDLSQFKDPGYDGLLRDYFSRKYANNHPDLIVAVMQPSLDFLLRDNQSLFPGVPIVFCGIDSSYLEEHPLPPTVTGVAIKRDYAPTIDIALRLQPETQNLFVVGGTAEFDRQIQAIARRDLAPYEDRVRITYLTDLPMPELLAVVAELPEKSAILYLTVFADGANRAFVPHDALAQIAGTASAPVYVAVDQYVDLGVVGGHVYSFGTHGQQAAQLGVRILRGETPPSLPVVELATYADIFDWRQLHRWGFDETRLPAGSEIRHRILSPWDAYKGYIVAGVTVAVLQSALIVGLLVSLTQRRRADALARQAEARRREAEDEARRQRDELAHALRLTTLGELMASVTHELGQPLTAILSNVYAIRRFAANGTIGPEELTEAISDIGDDVKRAADTIERLRGLLRKHHSERSLVDLNGIVKDVVRMLQSDLKVKGINVEFRRAQRLPMIVGDPVQLRQVILNLLVNAEDAITRGPGGERKIRIETRLVNEEAVAVVIRDTGGGAEGGDLESMFQRFTSTKPNGLGMGLAISRSIVQAHHGRIWATRNDDRGLSLHVEIPAASVPVAL
jgi:signal transduction histidine kinase